MTEEKEDNESLRAGFHDFTPYDPFKTPGDHIEPYNPYKPKDFDQFRRRVITGSVEKSEKGMKKTSEDNLDTYLFDIPGFYPNEVRVTVSSRRVEVVCAVERSDAQVVERYLSYSFDIDETQQIQSIDSSHGVLKIEVLRPENILKTGVFEIGYKHDDKKDN